MRSALGLPQAARSAAALRLFQAGEPFGLVKVEVLVWNHPFQPQKVLDAPHLPRRVRHQPLPADEQEVREREVAEPVLQVLGVEADAHGAPRRVDEAGGDVPKGQVLERGQSGGFGQSLSVVGYSPGHRVSHDHDEFGVAAHGEDAARGFFGDEVTRGLLHRDLSFQSPRHQVPAKKRTETVFVISKTKKSNIF